MKYHIGEKVKYDSGDWWFYGTITAVIENPICPSYRLNVDRMIKKNCKFSITQFEFEIEADSEIGSNLESDNWKSSEIEFLKKIQSVQMNEVVPQVAFQAESAQNQIFIPDVAPIQVVVPIPEETPVQVVLPITEQPLKQEKNDSPHLLKEEKPKRKRGDIWEANLKLFQNGVRNNSIHTWASLNRRLFKSGNLSQEKIDKLMIINFPFTLLRNQKSIAPQQENSETSLNPVIEAPKKKRKRDMWSVYFDKYRNGEKAHAVQTWASQNRKQYKTGMLKEEKFEKLVEINFPFETNRRKKNS